MSVAARGLSLVVVLFIAPTAVAEQAWSADLELSDDLSKEDRDVFERVLPLIAAAAEARFGAKPPYVRVVASPDHREVAVAYAEHENITHNVEAFARTWEGRSRFLAAGDTIFLVANDLAPQGDAKLSAVAHEYFHMLQHAASGPLPTAAAREEMSPGGPLWLGEGSAEYAQRLLTDDAGVFCDDMDRDRIYREAQASGARLADLETKPQNDAARGAGYTVGALAVEVLAQKHGDPAILAYFAGLRGGASWNESFEAVFGATPAAFYEEFEAARGEFTPSGKRVPMACLKYVAPQMIPGPSPLGLVGIVAVAGLVPTRRG